MGSWKRQLAYTTYGFVIANAVCADELKTLFLITSILPVSAIVRRMVNTSFTPTGPGATRRTSVEPSEESKKNSRKTRPFFLGLHTK